MEKHQFKPFDQVLVRDNNNEHWRAELYSHYSSESDNNCNHMCIGSHWVQCIPYNEETAHLIGTCNPYEEPEPKIWHVTNIKNGKAYEFTRNEFEHFIKTAVLNNKDITDFNARYVNN